MVAAWWAPFVHQVSLDGLACAPRGVANVAFLARVLAQLAEPQVPARMIERLESRMGG